MMVCVLTMDKLFKFPTYPQIVNNMCISYSNLLRNNYPHPWFLLKNVFFTII